MERRWKIIYKQVAASVLLLLFAAYYVDVNCFVHSHIVNGVTIVHSHVHRASHHSSDDGGHSTTQINLIAQLSSQLLTTDDITPVEQTVYSYLITTLGYEQAAKTVALHLCNTSLRAPPEA